MIENFKTYDIPLSYEDFCLKYKKVIDKKETNNICLNKEETDDSDWDE